MCANTCIMKSKIEYIVDAIINRDLFLTVCRSVIICLHAQDGRGTGTARSLKYLCTIRLFSLLLHFLRFTLIPPKVMLVSIKLP